MLILKNLKKFFNKLILIKKQEKHQEFFSAGLIEEFYWLDFVNKNRKKLM